MIAIAAVDEATKRELRVHVESGSGMRFIVQAILNALECLEVDQRLMLPFGHSDVPARSLNVSSIDRLRQNLVDTIMQYIPVSALRE